MDGGDKNKTLLDMCFGGLMAVAMTADAKLAFPMLVDLVPSHNQTRSWIVPESMQRRNSQCPSSVNLLRPDESFLSMGALEKRPCLMSSEKKA